MRIMLRPISAAVFLVTSLLCRQVFADVLPPAPPPALWKNTRMPVESRIDNLLSLLTLDEKINLLSLKGNLSTGQVDRLGIPSMPMADGPNGLRDGQSTSFPLGISAASTWDLPLIRREGEAIGEETAAKGKDCIYGPCVNIHRTPQGGRNMESYSEDPYLASRMAVQYIEGVQSRGVAACVKHFVCNNQEAFRHSVNVKVSERALREIYLPAFEASVREAHVLAVMSAFNQVNGTYASESYDLLTNRLKNQWGFPGFVVSDWGAIHDTVKAVTAGTDIELPVPDRYASGPIKDALAQRKITQGQIDDKVRRLLRVMLLTGQLDRPKVSDPKKIDTPGHRLVARKIAQEGIVLLKNSGGVLPFDIKTIKSIAVFGPNATPNQLGGRWSADVQPYANISPLDGIRAFVGKNVLVNYMSGMGPGLQHFDPVKPSVLAGAIGVTSRSEVVPPAAGPDPYAAVKSLAAKSDCAVVLVGLTNYLEGEEMDPPSLSLPSGQDALIQAVASANKHTVVVLNNGTPIDTNSWTNAVPGIIEEWYAGEEAGNALADILFGKVNPSGRLPDTIAFRREDYSDFPNYPGDGKNVSYSEGIYVGYRHFERAHILPRYPFGFGLSYTKFRFGKISCMPTMHASGKLIVSIPVRNIGKRSGAEVVQLYVSDLHPPIDRPVKELKGFARLTLAPGKADVATYTLDATALRYFDESANKWKVHPGRYALLVGASSADIRDRRVIQVVPQTPGDIAPGRTVWMRGNLTLPF